MTDHAPESRLIDLIGGLLSPEETHETVEHIRQCAECEARLQTLVSDRESLRSDPVPVMRDGRIELNQPRRTPRPRWRIGVAAVVLAIGALAANQILDRNAAPEYWIPVADETTVLRSQNDNGTGVADALESYLDRDAASAIEELQAYAPAPGDVTATTLRDLYLASALVNAGRPEEGLAILNLIGIESMPTQWRYHAQWVQYLALGRAGRNDEARACLEKLAQEPGEMGERARAELNRR